MVKTKRARTGVHGDTYTERMEKVKQVKRLAGELPDVPTRGRRYGLWVVAGISVLFFLFALSFFFASAKVVVTPKFTEVTFNETISATKDSNLSEGASFDLVIISGEEKKNISATETKETSVPARGTVILYNAFSKAPQPLLIDTRLEGSNGKLYKTVKAVTIPGQKADGTPGSVEVDIYADAPGPDSNSTPIDFKIFGFKGSPKYAKFYARSKTALTGGFTGTLPVVSPTDKARVNEELRTALEASLLRKATDQIPDGFVLFKDAVFLKTDTEVAEESMSDAGAVLTLKGTLYGFLFNDQKLTQKITKGKIPEYEGALVFIPNINNLTFSLTNRDISFADVTTINFKLEGKGTVVWKFDADKLREDLLGKSKDYFNQIFAKYPYVDSAELKLNPFWSGSFPKKPEDINITVNYPELI